MKLYQINEELECLLTNGYDSLTGEVTDPELDAKIKQLDLKLKDKVVSIGCVILGLEKEKEAHEEQASKQKAIACRLKKQVEWLRAYLLSNTNLNVGDKIKDERVSVSVRQSKAKIETLVPVEELPEEFLRIKTSVEPNISALEKVLKGEDLPFARLVDGKKYLVIK